MAQWLARLWAALGDTRRERWAPVYVRGLLGPGERKSVEPLAAHVAPDDYEQVHRFVCTSDWDPAPLERVLATKAEAMVGGRDAVRIIDDTALVEQGTRSVSLARQYARAAGKLTGDSRTSRQVRTRGFPCSAVATATCGCRATRRHVPSAHSSPRGRPACV